MATSSQAAIAAPAVGGRTINTTSESIAGWHDFRIDKFLATTKDYGVGKSIKSSTFHVGGYAWCIECFPCGDDRESAGWVCLDVCRQDDHHGSILSGDCRFTLMESLEDGYRHSQWHIFADYTNKHWLPYSCKFVRKDELDSLLKDDCFQLRCIVVIDKVPALPQPDLATVTMAGSHSHVLTVDDYSKIMEAHAVGEPMDSACRFAGHRWCIGLYRCGKDKDGTSSISAYICLDLEEELDDEVKVRFDMALLTHAGQIISAVQDIYTFSDTRDTYVCNFLSRMEHEPLPLVHDGIKIRCDMAIFEGITDMPNLSQGIAGDLQGSQQVRIRCDVTFQVGSHLFPAHKCVLATRCTAFMAAFFNPSGSENVDVTGQIVHVYDMEPRVFEALLHFIYTDALPEVHEEDKVTMAQGLLVAADRYAMERLKLICGDLLCSYINDSRTAVTTLDLADKHGCRRLKEACMKFLMDQLAKVPS